MAKDPAFLFYTNDFMSGTQFMTDDQLGKYLRILMAQHQHGHLSEDQVIFICKSHDNHIFSKLKKDNDGFWFNERLEIEIIKRKNFVESRSKNKEGKTKKKIISKSYDFHMENKDINEDLNNIKRSITGKNEIFESIFSDDRFVADLSITHKGKNLQQAFEECYTHHSNAPNPPNELWEWKQKLNTWLTIKKSDNGHSKTKQQSNIDKLKADFIRDNFAGNGTG